MKGALFDILLETRVSSDVLSTGRFLCAVQFLLQSPRYLTAVSSLDNEFKMSSEGLEPVPFWPRGKCIVGLFLKALGRKSISSVCHCHFLTFLLFQGNQPCPRPEVGGGDTHLLPQAYWEHCPHLLCLLHHLWHPGCAGNVVIRYPLHLALYNPQGVPMP